MQTRRDLFPVLSILVCACGSSGGTDKPRDAAPAEADAQREVDASSVEADADLADAAVAPQHGGWRMRGRDRRHGYRIPSPGPSQATAEAAAFLTLESTAHIADVVIDEQGNLFLAVGSEAGPDTFEDSVRSYDPAGQLRWQAELPAYPQELALGPLGEVYAIVDDVVPANAELVSLSPAGQPRWSTPLAGAEHMVVADTGALVVSTHDGEGGYELVGVSRDGSETWRVAEGGGSFAIDGQGNTAVVLEVPNPPSLVPQAVAVASFDASGDERWRHDLRDDLGGGALTITADDDVFAAATIVSDGGVSTSTYAIGLSRDDDLLWDREIDNVLPSDWIVVLSDSLVIPASSSVGLAPRSVTVAMADGASVVGTLNLCDRALLGDSNDLVYSSCDGDSIRAAENDGDIVDTWTAPDTFELFAADDGTTYLVPAPYVDGNQLRRIAAP